MALKRDFQREICDVNISQTKLLKTLSVHELLTTCKLIVKERKIMGQYLKGKGPVKSRDHEASQQPRLL